MTDDVLDPTNGIEDDPVDQLEIPDRAFWESLREVFEYYLPWEFRLFWMKPWFLRPPREVFDSLRHLHWWLNEAKEAGMFEDRAKKK